MKFVFGALLLLLSVTARAEFSAITVAGSVKSFTEKTVTLLINRRDVRLPRELIQQKDLKSGDAVLVTLRGSQIQYLLAKDVHRDASDEARAPASSERAGERVGERPVNNPLKK